MRRVMVGAIVLALATAGCEMRAEIEVEEDGSGTIGMVFAMEALLFGTMPSDMDPLAMARADLRDDPIPWTIEEYVNNGMKGFRAVAPFRSVEHLREMLAEQASGDGQTPMDPDGLVLEQLASGGWRFEMSGDAPGVDLAGGPLSPFGEDVGSPSFGGEFGDDGSFTPEMPQIPGLAADALRFEFHVTLPGDAAEHNSPRVDRDDGKSTFQWRFNLADTHPITLKASTTPAGMSVPLIPIAALLLLGGVVVFLRRRRGPTGGSGLPPVVLEGLPPLADERGEPFVAARASASPSEQLSGESAEPSVPAEQPSLLAELGND